MSEAKFTPGPWTIARDKAGEIDGIDSAGKDEYGRQNTVLMAMGDYGYGAVLDIGEEDAHLIAAAPDLYAALDAIDGEIPCGCGTKPHWKDCFAGMIETALAKARGK